jgi:hypothetical protein
MGKNPTGCFLPKTSENIPNMPDRILKAPFKTTELGDFVTLV